MRTARGLPSSRQDAKGHQSRYEYDKANRLTALVNENNATYSCADTDQIATALELTDREGEIVWQATYRSWGSIEQLVVDDVERNLRFQG